MLIMWNFTFSFNFNDIKLNFPSHSLCHTKVWSHFLFSNISSVKVNRNAHNQKICEDNIVPHTDFAQANLQKAGIKVTSVRAVLHVSSFLAQEN